MPLYDLHKQTRLTARRLAISISFYYLFLMPASGSDFSATSDEMGLGFALTEFQLLQPLTEGPSPELLPDLLPEKQSPCSGE